MNPSDPKPCPVCGATCEVRTWSQCMHIETFEKDGVRHRHDPNKKYDEFRCHNGHRETREPYYVACVCGWSAA